MEKLFMNTKQCRRCGGEKDLKDFGFRGDKRMTVCKQCSRSNPGKSVKTTHDHPWLRAIYSKKWSTK
jgi:hypothetical protein